MKIINKILFPTDFSETAQNAFRYCLILADQYEARIELLHVVYPEYETLDLPVLAAKATQDRAEAARVLQQSFIEMGITQVQVNYQFKNLPVINAAVELGTPGGIIVDVARRDDADLIVMGTKGEHNILERFLGSVTTSVIENAPCHIWVVPEHANFERVDMIAYASDLKDTDPYHILALGKILDPFSPIIHCIHVNKDSSMDEALDFATLGSFIERNAPALQVNFHPLLNESIINGIEAFVDNHAIDLLVMFAPSHSWIDRIIHRSATKTMALDTHIPLLLLKNK